MNGAGRKFFVTGKESKRRSVDILRRNLVSYIDDLRVRIARKHDALHRSNKAILRPKVGQQRDRRFQVSSFNFKVAVSCFRSARTATPTNLKLETSHLKLISFSYPP